MTAAAAVGAWAQVADGCVDNRGRPVRDVDDPLLPVMARAGREGGEPTLRINYGVMARAPDDVRLFFVAYECARHALGLPVDATLDAGQARRADCWALEALRISGELDQPGSVAALQAELAFTPEQWRQLPGPQRTIDFAACQRGGALRLPPDAVPSPGQQISNRCIHACGDTLWHCQRSCSLAACGRQCESTFDACQARCPAP